MQMQIYMYYICTCAKMLYACCIIYIMCVYMYGIYIYTVNCICTVHFIYQEMPTAKTNGAHSEIVDGCGEPAQRKQKSKNNNR